MIVRSPASSQVRAAGVVVLALGLWGALIPFVGPTFGYGMGGAEAWDWTESRATLHLAPGIAAALGGGLLLTGRGRAAQLWGALVALAGGIWFVVAPSLHPLWADASGGMMMHSGSATSSALSALGYHYGTGALITAGAAYALGVLVATRGTGPDVEPRVDTLHGPDDRAREASLAQR